MEIKCLICFFPAACLEKCEKETLGRSGIFSRISPETHKLFQNKRPLVYLQLAYFRVSIAFLIARMI